MTDPFSDAAHSGVYRAARAEEPLATARARGLHVARIALAARADKQRLLGALAAALDFPDWFGGNWDALEDCLTDLSWIPSAGYLILLEGCGGLPSDDFGVLRDVLASAAEFWSERGKPFYVVIVGGPDSLPEFGRAAKA